MRLVTLFLATSVTVFSCCFGWLDLRTPEPSASVGLLLEGIDRICNEEHFPDLLVLENEAPGGSLISFVNWRRPVTIINATYATKVKTISCIVGFIASPKLAKVTVRHLESFVSWIVVVPHDVIEIVRETAREMVKCVMHYFCYDRATLAGSWISERNGQTIRWPERTSPDVLDATDTNTDMKGQQLVFLNVDLSRDVTYDVAIGETIAHRHNGSFRMAVSLMECRDYMYSPMYTNTFGRFLMLPETFQMCFLVPRSTRKSIFSVLLDPFDLPSWMVLLATVCTMSIVLSMAGESYRRYSVPLVVLELVMSVINGPTHKFDGRFEVRIIGLYMMMSIVLLSCYQSLVISFMAVARYYPELDTIDQLNETCQFQSDPFLQSIGFKFRHHFHTFEYLSSQETMWQQKVCSMVPCYDLISAHSTVPLLGMNDREEVQHFWRLFRFSKARLHSSTVMYLIFHSSTMRSLIERYTARFLEAHLHHYPMLLNGMPATFQDESGPPLHVVAATAEELMIVWLIYLLGCLRMTWNYK
uniref:Ionotropic glutamate receptor C-terminal domain-containing protein n=1 Tax=Anopheles albimanus TaxID=7167 RepID=A0A182F1C8_ANOAL